MPERPENAANNSDDDRIARRKELELLELTRKFRFKFFMGLLFIMTGLLCFVLVFLIQTGKDATFSESELDDPLSLQAQQSNQNSNLQSRQHMQEEEAGKESSGWSKWLPDRYSLHSMLSSVGLMTGKFALYPLLYF